MFLSSVSEPARFLSSVPEPARFLSSVPEPARFLSSVPEPARFLSSDFDDAPTLPLSLSLSLSECLSVSPCLSQPLALPLPVSPSTHVGSMASDRWARIPEATLGAASGAGGQSAQSPFPRAPLARWCVDVACAHSEQETKMGLANKSHVQSSARGPRVEATGRHRGIKRYLGRCRMQSERLLQVDLLYLCCIGMTFASA